MMICRLTREGRMKEGDLIQTPLTDEQKRKPVPWLARAEEAGDD
jgi:hypothetical protein